MRIFNEHHIPQEENHRRSLLLMLFLIGAATGIVSIYDGLQSLFEKINFSKRFRNQYGVSISISPDDPLSLTIFKTRALLISPFFLIYNRIIKNIDKIYDRREFLEEVAGIVITLLCADKIIKTQITDFARILYGQYQSWD